MGNDVWSFQGTPYSHELDDSKGHDYAMLSENAGPAGPKFPVRRVAQAHTLYRRLAHSPGILHTSDCCGDADAGGAPERKRWSGGDQSTARRPASNLLVVDSDHEGRKEASHSASTPHQRLTFRSPKKRSFAHSLARSIFASGAATAGGGARLGARGAL